MELELKIMMWGTSPLLIPKNQLSSIPITSDIVVPITCTKNIHTVSFSLKRSLKYIKEWVLKN